MRLALSSAAAPDLELPELLESCARRGIEGLELVPGDAHGVAPGLSSRAVAELRRVLAASPVRIVGLYLPDAAVDDAEELARLSIAFGAPLVAPAEIASRDVFRRVATIMAAEGGTLLHRQGMNEPEAHAAGAGVAWEARPGVDVVPGAIPGRVRYVRLHGGGPEAAGQAGQGVGALMSRLALARFSGPLVLTPGDPRFHYAWRAWLGRAGGWGCGSRTGDPVIHSLQPA